jgi:hypothetical protein
MTSGGLGRGAQEVAGRLTLPERKHINNPFAERLKKN